MENTFTHFEDGLFTLEASYRKPNYPAGEFSDIFDPGLVVVDMSVDEIKDALCDGELLGKLDLGQDVVEACYESLPQN